MSTPSLPSTNREWHRRVWALSWPIIISNLSVPLAGVVDTAVVGHLPDPIHIGAVAIGALIFSTLYWLFGFLRMSTTGFVAQSVGAEDEAELGATVIRAGILAGLVGFILIAAQYPIREASFFFMMGTSEVEAIAREYIDIRIYGAPAALLNWVVLGLLFGLQRMRAALVVQLALNVCNVILDVLFVVGFGWGVSGVAVATIISEYLALFIGLWLIRHNINAFIINIDWQLTLSVDRVMMTFIVNINIMLRSLFTLLVFFYFTSLSARFGDIILAANVILLHLLNLIAYGMDGFANAVEALGGNAFGRKNLTAFRRSVRITTFWAFLFAIGFTMIYWALGPFFIGLMTDIGSVKVTAEDFLPWIVALPLISVWGFQLDGIFIGATHSKEMRNSMFVAMIVFLISVWLLTPKLENDGLWLSMCFFMLARAITMSLYYPRIEKALKVDIIK